MSLDISLNKRIMTSVYSGNITHNLVPMWHKAGCYGALYKSQGLKAGEIVRTLNVALTKMKKDPAAYRALEPGNRWGTYEVAIRFLEEVIRNCKEHPTSVIGVSA